MAVCLLESASIKTLRFFRNIGGDLGYYMRIVIRYGKNCPFPHILNVDNKYSLLRILLLLHLGTEGETENSPSM